MIYCVVPPELGEDVFRRLEDHYRDNPNVKVMWERRRSERRRSSQGAGGGKREVRDRRRRRPADTTDV